MFFFAVTLEAVRFEDRSHMRLETG